MGARRLANLVNKGRMFEEVILTPEVLEAMAQVLGPKFKLSSVNLRSADPHSACDQPLHARGQVRGDPRSFRGRLAGDGVEVVPLGVAEAQGSGQRGEHLG